MTIAEEAIWVEAGAGPAASRNVNAAHNPIASLNPDAAGFSRANRVCGAGDFVFVVFERTSQCLSLLLFDADGQP
jgi:hypothetical protein